MMRMWPLIPEIIVGFEQINEQTNRQKAPTSSRVTLSRGVVTISQTFVHDVVWLYGDWEANRTTHKGTLPPLLPPW